MTSMQARAKTAAATLWRHVRARARTRWAKATATTAVAIVLLGLLAPYFLDADRYRGTIAQLISEQTGRQVRLGTIRAQFLPHVGFSVKDAHLGNPTGFAAGELVAAQEVRGALAFWPLVLHREFLLTSLELDRPRLTLVEDESGRNNYTFAPAGPVVTADVAQALPAAPLSGSSAALQVAQLTLRDAEVIFGSVSEDGRVTPLVDAAGLNADLRQLQLDPLDVRVWQADAKLAGTRLATANWSGPVSITSGSVKLRGGELEASLAVDLGQAAHVDATISVADVERAVVQFDLKSPDVDVNALLAGYRPPSAAAPKRVEASAPKVVFAATDQTAPTPPYVGVPIAVGHLTAQKIRVKPYAAGPLAVDIRLYAERAEIWPFTLRLEGGSLQATARTDQQQRPPRFSANLEARNIDVGRLLNPYPAVRGKFAGTGEFDLQMFGSLDQAWLPSLEGRGGFAVRNGRIAGFNLAGVAQSLANAAGLNGDTPFTAITGDLALQREQVTSRDIHLASPRGTVDLRGWCRFDSVLSYDGQATVDLSAAANAGATQGATNADPSAAAINKLAKKIGRVTVPISVRGTFARPELAPGHGVPNFPVPNDPKQPGAFPNLFGK